jgi:type IV pilus assembly protein PilZ
MSIEDDKEAGKGARPSVLSLHIKERSALYAAYMPHLKHGGVFVPTNKPYRLRDEVFLLLSILDDPSKIPVAGHVAWVTPSNNQANKVQGVGVQFTDDESGQSARRRIEGALGNLNPSTRPTHTY